MDFNNTFPEWKNEGAAPPEELQTNGFNGGDKPPAAWLNWLCSLVSKCIKELQTKLGSHADDKENPHNVTVEQLGLENVDNTADSDKNVKFASEAGVGRKVAHNLIMRFNGGKTEGTDLWTFDGSAGKSVNITPDKINAAEKNLSNVSDTVLKEKVKALITTGTPVVAATSADGVTYTATVDDVTELYNGLQITIIPDINNSTTAPTLNNNGLGAVRMYRPLSFSTFVATAPEMNFIRANTPCRLMYHANYASGGIWLLAEKQKTSAQDLYGNVPVQNGGLYFSGDTTDEDKKEALTNLKNLGVQPKITSGTSEPTGGSDGDVYIQIIS